VNIAVITGASAGMGRQLVLQLAEKEAFAGGNLIAWVMDTINRATPAIRAILLFFINNRGILLTRNQLLDAIWDVAGDYVNDNTLTVYIKRLREKIEDEPTNPKIILTVRGSGYKVEA